MALNPHLVGSVPTTQPQPVAAPSLDGPGFKLAEGAPGSLKWIVILTAYRRRLLDDDNHVGSLKPIRDAVAQHLGVDDGSPRIKFEYHQNKTSGRVGVSVVIHEYEHIQKSG